MSVTTIKAYKPGDLVKLKSGGPCMAVKYTDDDQPIRQGQERFWCTWFDPYGEIRSAVFPSKVLVNATTGDSIKWYSVGATK